MGLLFERGKIEETKIPDDVVNYSGAIHLKIVPLKSQRFYCRSF
jgi:hypothetical protein